MEKTKSEKLFKDFLNPLYQGVCKMKALRTTAFLVALLVVPLLASPAFAASYGELDTSWVPFGTINQSADDRAVLGFWITDVVDSQYLESVTVTSFVQQAYSVEYVKLYAETNATIGLQSGSDSLLAAYDTRDSQFVANDTLTLNSLHYQLSGVAGDTNRFYIAIDAHTDSIDAAPVVYDGQCMEVVILPGRVALDAEASPDTIYNRSYFDPGAPGGSYRLCFDLSPPNACIVYPDSGKIFAGPFVVKARSEDLDIAGACLWYRLRPDLNDPPGGNIGQWTACDPDTCMYRPDGELIFLDTLGCMEGLDYTGWIELLAVSYDETGNQQDTTSAYAAACVEDDLGELVPGHFLFHWDTSQAVVQVVSVNDTIAPQSPCGFNVVAQGVNKVVIDAPDAQPTDLFTIEVFALVDGPGGYRIDYRNDVTMPCTIDVYVENWDAETQNIYVHVTQQWDGQNLVPDPLVIPLCVPPQKAPWVEIVAPHEWQRVPCSKTDLTCVDVWAGLTPGAPDTMVTRVQFLWADSPGGPWDLIEEVFVKDGDYWKTCWNNKQWLDSGQLQDGDEVFFLAIAYSQFDVPDTSHMVKVYLDCEAPQVQLMIEDVINTCEEEPGTGTPKIAGEIDLKAIVLGDPVDISAVSFWYKPHSDPDLPANWVLLCVAEPAWSDNIFMCTYNTNDLANNTWYDIRIFVVDQAGNVWLDNDEDGMFDDYTFPAAVAAGAGITVYVDNEAPQPAISMVADLVADIWNINPSHWLGCNGNAYVQAGNDIMAEISVLPSEDSCEAMKVNWYLEIAGSWVSLGTSAQPYHFPVTFNPLTQGLIDPYELEDGWWVGLLKAELHDFLGNAKADTINLYILDITPSQAVIVEPENDSYVSGDVQLSVAALNGYEIAKVCYEYRPDGGASWLPVNGGYANACVTRSCEPPPAPAPGVGGGAAVIGEFTLVWHTLNTVADGVYYLRAVATDCDNNVDGNPRTIRVTVANGLPTAVMEVPSTDCQRACPDDPEVTITYVGDAVTLYATASSGAVPIDRVEFMYKDVFLYPDTNWHVIDADYFPSGGKYSVVWNTGDPLVSDGRYYLKARAYNAAGRYGDSQPVEVSVDNTAPLAEVVSVMGEPNPDGMDITKGDVIDIEVFAMDSLSPEGWTRCYNSGVVGFKVCIATCDTADEEITKCFEVSPASDGYDTVQWNTSGLEFEGCDECYELWVEAWDCLGNMAASGKVQVYVSDMKAPVTTIGGFDGNYIYAYSTEEVSGVRFEYSDSAVIDWTSIGISEPIEDFVCSGMYLYKASWNPSSLANGTYMIRAVSHDQCSNQDDDMAPAAYITMFAGILTPRNPGALGAMNFLKNWCTGDMQGIVRQSSLLGAPVVIGKYGSSYQCVEMQSVPQNPLEFVGSFNASPIASGGTAQFFSSVSWVVSPPPMTGEPTRVTYLATGSFDVVEVKADLGAHGTFGGLAELTIQGGSVDHDRYVWVAPTEIPWTPPDQPDILPIGVRMGTETYAMHISFTDCDWCCQYYATHFGGHGSDAAGAGLENGDTCCFNAGKYAKVKLWYDPQVNVPAEELAVAWWDCEKGQYSFEGISYHSTEGFDTLAHTVEFATTCLSGPFVVVQFLERQCEGSIMVNMLGIEPYCNGYTNAMPRFNALIRDDVSCVDESSIKFRLDLYQPGELVTIYDGGGWADGFGDFPDAGYDTTSHILKAGWDADETAADPLAAGNHMATVGAVNENVQTCTDTMLFIVDARMPDVTWRSSWVLGRKPAFTLIMTDDAAGVNKDAIWMDIYDADESTQPYDKDLLFTIYPDGVDEFWLDDSTLYVELDDPCDGQYIHAVIYDGSYASDYDEYNGWTWRGYDGGVTDCVGNKASAEYLVFPVDRVGPVAKLLSSKFASPVKIKVTDPADPVLPGKPGSGVDASSFRITENGVDVQSFAFDSSAGILTYTPTVSGPIWVEIVMKDMVGNESSLAFDNSEGFLAQGPMFDTLSLRPIIRLRIYDDSSGVNWSTLRVFEDGLLICEGLACIDEETISLDTTDGVLEYTPNGGGTALEIRIRDNAGNLTIVSFVTEEDVLVLNPHNYPNPFDPRGSPTTIDLGMSKSAYVTIKMYDFGGEFVKVLQKDEWTAPTRELKWDGTTEDGTRVANGTYLCYIQAKDDKGITKTAVIKITVLKRDE